MTNMQLNRLETAARIIREHQQAIAEYHRMSEYIGESTHLTFWNSGNSEHSIAIDGKKMQALFDQIKKDAELAIMRQRKIHQDAINNFPAAYVERGE